MENTCSHVGFYNTNTDNKVPVWKKADTPQLAIIVWLHSDWAEPSHLPQITVARACSPPETHLALSSVQMYCEIPVVVPDLSILF